LTQTGESADPALAARAAKGDQAAFGMLMQRHKGWVYRFVRRYVLDAEEAYDVVQESFAAAWIGLPRYDPERPFEVWLRRIALNKCRDRARKTAVRRVLFGFAGSSETRPEIADPTVGPDEAAASRAALARLEAAIAALPRGLKEPLVLTALEGLSHKEAGEVLGLNPKAVETRIYRARKQLAQVLARTDIADLTAGDD
jgi:RNA polymerase sigma-70 factor (ECF subfamily)